MGIGHAAVALGASRIEARVNIGVLIFAAFLADFLLGIFAALGLENAHIPPDFASPHYLTFTFPYSHGLVPLIIWGISLGAVLCGLDGRDRRLAFWIIAALVFSHFVLDALVHVRELPVLGENSLKVGMALWNHLPLELTLETLMALAGLVIYCKLPGSSKHARVGMCVYVLLLTGLTWTQLFSTVAPTHRELVTTWIVAPIVFALVRYLLDRKRVAALAA